LARLDPAAAAAILPSNGRRIVRALEVVTLRGSFQATLPGPRPFYDSVQVGVDRADLDERLAWRTRQMFERGLVDEVRSLIRRGLREGRTASRALGYAQVLEAMDVASAGADTDCLAAALQAAERRTVQATRRFARRQRSWFRRDPRVHWLAEPTSGNGPRSDQDAELFELVVTTALNWWNVSHH
jgi:tRNA dimethylallyltransferase